MIKSKREKYKANVLKSEKDNRQWSVKTTSKRVEKIRHVKIRVSQRGRKKGLNWKTVGEKDKQMLR